MYFLFLSFITDGEWYWFSLYNSEVKSSQIYLSKNKEWFYRYYGLGKS